MSKKLTDLQKKILKLAEDQRLEDLTYRQIASMVGASHPYTAQQSVNSLAKKGYLQFIDGKPYLIGELADIADTADGEESSCFILHRWGKWSSGHVQIRHCIKCNREQRKMAKGPTNV